MRVLLITLAIGNDPHGIPYIDTYNRIFRRSHEVYAAKHGYDFRIQANFLDTNYYHVTLTTMQKFLVCCQPWSADYDYILFIDADTWINPDAPPLHTACDWKGKIGMVDEYTQPTPEERARIQIRNGWERTSKEYYALCGFDLDTPHVLNSGILVFQPDLHANLMRELYDTYFEEMIGNPREVYEQTCLAYELIKRDMVHIMPNEWNALWSLYKKDESLSSLQTFVDQNWISHFAGVIDYEKVPNLILRQPAASHPESSGHSE